MRVSAWAVIGILLSAIVQAVVQAITGDWLQRHPGWLGTLIRALITSPWTITAAACCIIIVHAMLASQASRRWAAKWQGKIESQAGALTALTNERDELRRELRLAEARTAIVEQERNELKMRAAPRASSTTDRLAPPGLTLLAEVQRETGSGHVRAKIFRGDSGWYRPWVEIREGRDKESWPHPDTAADVGVLSELRGRLDTFANRHEWAREDLQTLWSEAVATDALLSPPRLTILTEPVVPGGGVRFPQLQARCIATNTSGQLLTIQRAYIDDGIRGNADIRVDTGGMTLIDHQMYGEVGHDANDEPYQGGTFPKTLQPGGHVEVYWDRGDLTRNIEVKLRHLGRAYDDMVVHAVFVDTVGTKYVSGEIPIPRAGLIEARDARS